MHCACVPQCNVISISPKVPIYLTMPFPKIGQRNGMGRPNASIPRACPASRLNPPPCFCGTQTATEDEARDFAFWRNGGLRLHLDADCPRDRNLLVGSNGRPPRPPSLRHCIEEVGARSDDLSTSKLWTRLLNEPTTRQGVCRVGICRASITNQAMLGQHPELQEVYSPMLLAPS